MKNLFIALGILVSAFAVTAGEHSDRLVKLDADKDGKISMEEAAADPALNVLFKEIDADGDGFISAEELKKVGKNTPQG